MGCFTACFRHLKHKKISKSRKNNNAIPPSKNQCLHSLLQTYDVSEVIVEEAEIEDTGKPIADSNEEEEQLNRSSRKKVVTFDLNVKTYGECSNQEDEKAEVENEKEKGDNEESSDSSLISYPLNHRYHNSRNGDDELEDLGLLEDDVIEEESSESLFSLSIESRKSVARADMEEISSPFQPLQRDAKTKTIGLNPNARDRTQSVQSVLNPIENMSQWKAAKAKTAAALEEEPQEKENQILDFEQKGHFLKKKPKENEIAVDTSLSSWLNKTPNSKDSSGSSVGMPIIGTVGSYWRHTGQATTDSDSGSSCRGELGGSRRKKIDQFATPFQSRIESAVEN